MTLKTPPSFTLVTRAAMIAVMDASVCTVENCSPQVGVEMYHPNKYLQWCDEDCFGIDDYKKFICSFRLDDRKFL